MFDPKAMILSSPDFLLLDEMARLAGYATEDFDVQTKKWKSDRKVFTFLDNGIECFPVYALNHADNYQPRKAFVEILRIFGDKRSDWGIAFWFAGLNSFLDDQRPQDLLATEPDWVIESAKDGLMGIQHG